MKKRWIVVGLMFSVLVAMAGNVGAQPMWGTWGAQAASPLGLSAEQMSQIQSIVNQWQIEMQSLWSNLQAKNMELASLVSSANADPSAVEVKTKEIGDLQAQIQRKSVEQQSAVREVLTEEQKVLFDQQGLGYGWGRGPCGLGLGAGWGAGFGRGRGFGGGRGFGWTTGSPLGYGLGGGVQGPGYGTIGWGRGPCGMGLGRASWGRGRGRW